MNWRISNMLRGRPFAAVLGLTGALLSAAGGTAVAQSHLSASEDGLVGAWAVQVTLRNCATNAPLGPPFSSLVTFHRGGTLSESAGSLAFAIGQRSAGHGTWAREGQSTYRQSVLALMLFDSAPNLPGPGFDPSLPVSPGFSAGWAAITQAVRFRGGDRFTSTGTNAFYETTGALYRTGCSTATGERVE